MKIEDLKDLKITTDSAFAHGYNTALDFIIKHCLQIKIQNKEIDLTMDVLCWQHDLYIPNKVYKYESEYSKENRNLNIRLKEVKDDKQI